jgi:hypothetical protein
MAHIIRLKKLWRHSLGKQGPKVLALCRTHLDHHKQS